MPDGGALLAIAILASVVYTAGGRGRKAVAGFYQRRVNAWKGSSPKPAPLGVKAGAAIATGVVGGGLYLWAFLKGMREGWPEGSKAGRDWYAKRLAKEANGGAEEPGLCPICKFNMAKHGWPVQHKNPQGELCRYDWHTDPRWRRCPHCQAILIPGTTCTDCDQPKEEAQPAKANGANASRSETTGSQQPAQRCRAKHRGKQCPNDADPLLGNGLCTKDDALAAARPQNRPAKRRRPQVRLVADPEPGGEGEEKMINSATNGDVHNLDQILSELATVVDEQTAEYEDAAQALKRAEDELIAGRELQHWLAGQEFPAPMQGRAADLVNDLEGAVKAAEDRLAAAEHQVLSSREASVALAPQTQVKDAVIAAGGMAQRSGYAV